MSKRFRLLLSLAACLATLGMSIAPSAAVELASHRAIYSLKLSQAKPDSQITGVTGRLVIEWQDTCDGYTTNQRFLTAFGDNEGQSTITDLWISSWESRDGNIFRFNLTSLANGAVQERSRGLARRGAVGGKDGEITYEEPRVERRALPADTIFPSAHTEDLIEAAKRGEHTLERLVFDGGAENGVSYVSAFIGLEVPPKPAPMADGGNGASALTGGRIWPVRLAFYPHQKGDDIPDYEMSYLMHENGVATDIQFDYGDFSVAADLTKIEGLPGCTAKKR